MEMIVSQSSSEAAKVLLILRAAILSWGAFFALGLSVFVSFFVFKKYTLLYIKYIKNKNLTGVHSILFCDAAQAYTTLQYSSNHTINDIHPTLWCLTCCVEPSSQNHYVMHDPPLPEKHYAAPKVPLKNRRSDSHVVLVLDITTKYCKTFPSSAIGGPEWCIGWLLVVSISKVIMEMLEWSVHPPRGEQRCTKLQNTKKGHSCGI